MRYFFLALAFSVSSVLSQPVQTDRVNIRLRGEYIWESDFSKDQYGGQDATHAGATLTVPVFESETMRFYTGAAFNTIEFGASSAPVPTSLQSVHALLGFDYLVNGEPAVILQTRPGFQYAGDFESDSFDAPTLLTGAMKWNDSLVVVGGVIYTRFREYPVLPVFGAIWTVNDRVTVNGVLPQPGVNIKLSEDSTLFLGGEMAGGTYRVSQDQKHYRGDHLDYFEIRAGVALEHRISENFSARAGAGWAITRQFHFEDADDRYRVEGAPYVQLSLNALF